MRWQESQMSYPGSLSSTRRLEERLETWSCIHACLKQVWRGYTKNPWRWFSLTFECRNSKGWKWPPFFINASCLLCNYKGPNTTFSIPFYINHQRTISAVAITAGQRKIYPKKQQKQLVHSGRKTALNASMKEISKITTYGFDWSQRKGKYTCRNTSIS